MGLSRCVFRLCVGGKAPEVKAEEKKEGEDEKKQEEVWKMRTWRLVLIALACLYISPFSCAHDKYLSWIGLHAHISCCVGRERDRSGDRVQAFRHACLPGTSLMVRKDGRGQTEERGRLNERLSIYACALLASPQRAKCMCCNFHVSFDHVHMDVCVCVCVCCTPQADMLPLIRFPVMDASHLATEVEQTKLLTQDQLLALFTYIGTL